MVKIYDKASKGKAVKAPMKPTAKMPMSKGSAKPSMQTPKDKLKSMVNGKQNGKKGS